MKFAIFSGEGGPLPVGATVTSATLSLHKHSYYDYTYRLRPLLSAWVESEVTWSQRLAGVPWVGPGATAVGSDLSLSYDAEAAAPWNPGWVTFDVTSGVQAIASGRPNHGWALEAVSGNNNPKEFRSSEYTADLSLRPRLVVSYTVGAPNLPPTISGTPQSSVVAGQSFSFTPTARDPEGQALTFSIGNKPAWASFDAATGRLYGSPLASQAGTYSGISISARDSQYSVSLPAFSVTVLAPTNGSATVRWSPPNTNVDGTPITNLAGFRIVYGQSASNLSKSVSIPNPAITSAFIEGLSSGTWYFAVKAYTTSSVESDLSSIGQKTIY